MTVLLRTLWIGFFLVISGPLAAQEHDSPDKLWKDVQKTFDEQEGAARNDALGALRQYRGNSSPENFQKYYEAWQEYRKVQNFRKEIDPLAPGGPASVTPSTATAVQVALPDKIVECTGPVCDQVRRLAEGYKVLSGTSKTTPDGRLNPAYVEQRDKLIETEWENLSPGDRRLLEEVLAVLEKDSSVTLSPARRATAVPDPFGVPKASGAATNDLRRLQKRLNQLEQVPKSESGAPRDLDRLIADERERLKSAGTIPSGGRGQGYAPKGQKPTDICPACG